VPRSHSGNRSTIRREVDEYLKSSIRQHAFFVMRRLISVVVPEGFYVGRKRWSRTMSQEHRVHQNTGGGGNQRAAQRICNGANRDIKRMPIGTNVGLAF